MALNMDEEKSEHIPPPQKINAEAKYGEQFIYLYNTPPNIIV